MNRLQVYSFADYLSVRTLAHGVKDSNDESISRAAMLMANLVSVIADKTSVLVPIPNRSGTAEYTMQIARTISEMTGVRCVDILKSKPHTPQYYRKLKYGIHGMSLLRFWLSPCLPTGAKPILIDNVLDTGTTAMSAVRALDTNASLVVLGNTENYKLYDYPIHVFERSLAALS